MLLLDVNVNMKKNLFRFTLIELLVVITILAILMSLFIPALRSTMYIAKNTGCVTNYKNLHAGFFMYADDNNDFWPDRYTVSSASKFQDNYDGRILNSGTKWSMFPKIRPYFGNKLGPTFVCQLYGSNGGTDPNGTPETYGNPQKGLEFNYLSNPSRYYVKFDPDNKLTTNGTDRQGWGSDVTFNYYPNWSNKYVNNMVKKVGDQLDYKTSTGDIMSNLLFADRIVRDTNQISNGLNIYNAPERTQRILDIKQSKNWLMSTHAPPPGETYEMKWPRYEWHSTYGTRPGDGLNIIQGKFYSNWAYQDGSVKTIKSLTYDNLLQNEFLRVNNEGGDRFSIIPYE